MLASYKLIAAIVLSAVFLLGCLFFFFLHKETGWLDFQLNKSALLAIVEEASAQTKAGDNALAVKKNGAGSFPAFATRLADGTLVVSVVVYDKVHAGLSGYVYVSDPKRNWSSISSSAFHEWTSVAKINDHWWAVKSNLT